MEPETVRSGCGTMVAPNNWGGTALTARPATPKIGASMRNKGTRPTETERFWAKVDRSDTEGCWVWQATVSSSDYGMFWASALGRQVMAHRYAYELLVGPIPEGLQIDHLCRVRRCVNPAHLEPVTQTENILRGTNFAAVNAAKTECIRGHDLTGENAYVNAVGHRRCRICSQVSRKKYERKVEARNV